MSGATRPAATRSTSTPARTVAARAVGFARAAVESERRDATSRGLVRIPDAAEVYTQARNENFPVASRLLPRATREDLMAIYGFARLTDDIGDEVSGDRSGALDWLEEELERAVSGRATHPVMRRVGATVVARDLSLQPFKDLIEANRLDQRVRRYETFEALCGYCRLSANPVGRLVLETLGLATPDRIALSDDVCTGLQVVEHLQDVREDLGQDRVYLPLADLAEEGCDLAELSAPSASPALRRVVRTESARARRLLWSGSPLAASLPWRPRMAVAAFAAGGMAALDAIEQADFDVLATRSRPRAGRLAARLALLLLWHPEPAGDGTPVLASAPTTAAAVTTTPSHVLGGAHR